MCSALLISQGSMEGLRSMDGWGPLAVCHGGVQNVTGWLRSDGTDGTDRMGRSGLVCRSDLWDDRRFKDGLSHPP